MVAKRAGGPLRAIPGGLRIACPSGDSQIKGSRHPKSDIAAVGGMGFRLGDGLEEEDGDE
jgi:hypothetical protein